MGCYYLGYFSIYSVYIHFIPSPCDVLTKKILTAAISTHNCRYLHIHDTIQPKDSPEWGNTHGPFSVDGLNTLGKFTPFNFFTQFVRTQSQVFHWNVNIIHQVHSNRTSASKTIQISEETKNNFCDVNILKRCLHSTISDVNLPQLSNLVSQPLNLCFHCLFSIHALSSRASMSAPK